MRLAGAPRMLLRAAAAAVAAALLLAGGAQAQKNVEISRTVDLSMAVVRAQTDIRASGVTGGSYVVSFPVELASKLAYLQVIDAADERELTATRVKDSDGMANYEVALKIGSGDIHIRVFSTFTDSLTPVPAEIGQMDNQLVQFFDSHIVPSKYPTESQTSRFQLGVGSAESFTKKSPYAFQGKDLVFGPYKDVPAGSVSLSPLMIHYQNNAPFAKAAVAIREIEVSHWGNVAFEEFLEVHHAGAKLKGGFSRFDFQMKRCPAAFQGLVALLPHGARNIYYRDQIGNISNSEVRHRPHGVELDVEARFPLFGGWKTQFYQGYSVPVQELLTVGQGERYTLTVPFSVPFSEVWVSDLTVKVVLPEWARDVQVNVPFEVQESRTSRLTYLDTALSGGRPVIVLTKRNAVAEHIQPITVTYTFPKKAMLLEPLYLVMAFLAFFVICILFVRLDFRVKSPASAEPEKKKVQ